MTDKGKNLWHFSYNFWTMSGLLFPEGTDLSLHFVVATVTLHSPPHSFPPSSFPMV